MRLFLLLGVFVILAVAGFFAFSSSKSNNELKTFTDQAKGIEEKETKLVDIEASFAIFTNGTFRIFTASMYHNQSDDVYIESSNTNRVHVKKSGVTWDDFFKTLPMKLTRDCLTTGTGQTFCTNSSETLKFYINGQRDQNALGRAINNGDQLLVSYGNEDEAEIEKQLQQIP